MSDNINETYKGVPLKKYEGKISDLGYGYDIDFPE